MNHRTIGCSGLCFTAPLSHLVIPQGDKVRFSERYGYKPIKEIIPIESMDEPLSKV